MQLNIQPPEKRIRGQDPNVLSVHSIFDTIQGEGPFCGMPAVFIRLAGCNLQCPLCDTDYTSGRQERDLDSILSEVFRYPRPLVVITGGEPFRQPIRRLVERLIATGRMVQIESNGTLQPDPEMEFNTRTEQEAGCYVVCSPKAGRVHPAFHKIACAFKYVLNADSVDPVDGLPILALDHTAAPRVARPLADYRGIIYLQPVDVQDRQENQRHLLAVIKSCQRFGYRIQLQIHKIIGVE
jgi:7-carboxy-7-deazaguanine synthase